MALLQTEAPSAAVEMVVADFGLGPDWRGAEMEAVSRLSTTTARRLPPPAGGLVERRACGELQAEEQTVQVRVCWGMKEGRGSC